MSVEPNNAIVKTCFRKKKLRVQHSKLKKIPNNTLAREII